MRKTAIQRFEQKFVKVGSGCWEWAAGLDRHGYGRFRMGTEKIGAHRAAHTLYKGVIPEGMLVLHSCDNRKCVNPEHLRAGTAQDNTDDMHARNRRPNFSEIFRNRRSYKGEGSPASKLTSESVLKILSDSRTLETIAEDYGVTAGTIGHIKNGWSWTHITGIVRDAA